MSSSLTNRDQRPFEKAVKWALCFIFIDEIDILITGRSTTAKTLQTELLMQMLTRMDYLSWKQTELTPVVITMAANKQDRFDPALIPGTLVRKIQINIPNYDRRENYLPQLF